MKLQRKKKWKIPKDDELVWRSSCEVVEVGDKQIFKLETSRSVSWNLIREKNNNDNNTWRWRTSRWRSSNETKNEMNLFSTMVLVQEMMAKRW